MGNRHPLLPFACTLLLFGALNQAAFANSPAACPTGFAKLGESAEEAGHNLLFAGQAQGLSTKDLQWYALDALTHDEGLPGDLRHEAGSKMQWFTKPAAHEPWDHEWAKLSPADRAQAAAEFALTTFKDGGGDGNLRMGLIYQLGQSPRSDAHTMRLLIPIASGIRFGRNEELGQATEALQKIAQRQGSYPARFKSDVARTDPTDILQHEPIKSVRNLGGGVTTSLLIEFENGQHGVFKPRSGEFSYAGNNPHYVDFPREASFGPIAEDYLGNAAAREAGKSPLDVTKADTVVLKAGDKSYGVGSIQLFANGYYDMEHISGDPRYAKVWQKIMEQPQWHALTNRIRVIDYIEGNYDRLPLGINYRMNPKNFMIKMDGVDFTNPEKAWAQIQHANWDSLKGILIDNGLGRNAADAGKFNIEGYGHFPLAKDIPADLKESILHFDEARFRDEMKDKISQEGIDDTIRRVHEAKQRIQHGP